MNSIKSKILVVEDESIIAKDIAQTLKNIGYDVPAIASSGQEAISLAQELSPDLVLMDIVLHGDMDGIEAANAIRESLSIPIVFLTAYADEHILERSKITGAFGYLIKPFEERELRFTIEMAIYKSRTEKEKDELLKEKDRLITELQSAMANIRTLSGLLPICAWCKKVRDDKGYWNQVENFIQEHTDIEFTHGMCPDCQRKLEKELDVYKKSS